MSKIVYNAIIVVCIAFFSFATLWGIMHLPARSFSFETQSTQVNSPIENLAQLIKRFFSANTISVLVLGQPGAEYNGGALADSIFVVRFDPKSSVVHVISLPRDLWVADGDEQFKFNEVVHKKKVDYAIKKAEAITGVPLNGVVFVNLTMVKNIIDDVGGVDIVLSEPAYDWVSGFTMNAGQQHLNGEDALWLIRNRYNPAGDFFRENNQQKIVKALIAKFKALSGDNKMALLQKYVLKSGLLAQTSIDIEKLIPLIFSTNFSAIRMESIVLDFSTKLFKSSSVPGTFNGSSTMISVLLPTAGFEQYDQIRAYIQERITN